MSNPFNHIRYLERQQIDGQQWDACIDESPNGLIYGSRSYLDEMAPHWDALILGNYEAVMPLTWNKKWGIRYLYNPPLTPQLGIFSRIPITEDLIRTFLQEARKHFKFAEIFLNYANGGPGRQPFTNIVLDLNASYDKVRANYKKDLEKNLKRAAGFSLHYGPSSDIDSAIALYRKYYAARTPHVVAADYKRFARFCSNALHTDSAIVRTVSAQNDQPPLALSLLLKKKGRLYLLMSVCSPDGRKMEANHFLLDHLIREFAQTDTVLDFDGSEIPGIAHFYRNFGGVDQPFFFYRYNQLPWPLRLFKSKGDTSSIDRP